MLNNKTLGLFAAAKIGSLSLATACINAGASISSIDEFGFTPLHYSSLFGHYQIVSLLLEHGASINFMESNIVLPESTEQISPTRKLTTQNQSIVNITTTTLSVTDKKLQMVPSPIILAAYKCNLRICWLLLAAGFLSTEKDSFENTVLHVACMGAYSKKKKELLLRTLLSSGFEANAKNSFGASAYDLLPNTSRYERVLLACANLTTQCAATGKIFYKELEPIRYLCWASGAIFSEDASTETIVRVSMPIDTEQQRDEIVLVPVRMGAEIAYTVADAEATLEYALNPFILQSSKIESCHSVLNINNPMDEIIINEIKDTSSRISSTESDNQINIVTENEEIINASSTCNTNENIFKKKVSAPPFIFVIDETNEQSNENNETMIPKNLSSTSELSIEPKPSVSNFHGIADTIVEEDENIDDDTSVYEMNTKIKRSKDKQNLDDIIDEDFEQIDEASDTSKEDILTANLFNANAPESLLPLLFKQLNELQNIEDTTHNKNIFETAVQKNSNTILEPELYMNLEQIENLHKAAEIVKNLRGDAKLLTQYQSFLQKMHVSTTFVSNLQVIITNEQKNKLEKIANCIQTGQNDGVSNTLIQEAQQIQKVFELENKLVDSINNGKQFLVELENTIFTEEKCNEIKDLENCNIYLVLKNEIQEAIIQDQFIQDMLTKQMTSLGYTKNTVESSESDDIETNNNDAKNKSSDIEIIRVPNCRIILPKCQKSLVEDAICVRDKIQHMYKFFESLQMFCSSITHLEDAKSIPVSNIELSSTPSIMLTKAEQDIIQASLKVFAIEEANAKKLLTKSTSNSKLQKESIGNKNSKTKEQKKISGKKEDVILDKIPTEMENNIKRRPKLPLLLSFPIDWNGVPLPNTPVCTQCLKVFTAYDTYTKNMKFLVNHGLETTSNLLSSISSVAMKSFKKFEDIMYEERDRVTNARINLALSKAKQEKQTTSTKKK